MKCGSCLYTDGCCYTSLPPKVKCNITGEFHYHDDECNCEDIKTSKAEEFDRIRELLNQPGALTAINYDGPNAPSVSFGNTLTLDEAVVAYESLLRLPLYDEADADCTTMELPTAVGSTKCLVCGEDIIVNMWDSYTQICSTCKKAIKYIKEKFNEELENYEV